jgi:hypothetical protein
MEIGGDVIDASTPPHAALVAQLATSSRRTATGRQARNERSDILRFCASHVVPQHMSTLPHTSGNTHSSVVNMLRSSILDRAGHFCFASEFR